MAAGAMKDFVSSTSHYPPFDISAVPGFIVDAELSLCDVIDLLMAHPNRKRYAHGSGNAVGSALEQEMQHASHWGHIVLSLYISVNP